MKKLPEMIFNETRWAYGLTAPNAKRDLIIAKEALLGKSFKEIGAAHSISGERCSQVFRSEMQYLNRIFEQSVYQSVFPIEKYPKAWAKYRNGKPFFAGHGRFFRNVKPYADFYVAGIDAILCRLGYKRDSIMTKRIFGDASPIFKEITIEENGVQLIGIDFVSQGETDSNTTCTDSLYNHMIGFIGNGIKAQLSIIISVNSGRDWTAQPWDKGDLSREINTILDNFAGDYKIEWPDATGIELYNKVLELMFDPKRFSGVLDIEVNIRDVEAHLDAVMRNGNAEGIPLILEHVPMVEYGVGFGTKLLDGTYVTIDRHFVYNALTVQLNEIVNLQKLYGNTDNSVWFYEYGLQQLVRYLQTELNVENHFCVVLIEVFQYDDLWALRTSIPNHDPIILGQLQLP